MTPPHSSGAAATIVEARRDADRDVGSNRGELGEAAVHVPAGEPRGPAQVLAATRAEAAGAVEVGEPGRARPIADGPAVDAGADRHDLADSLVTRHDGAPMRRQVAARDLEVRPADRAGRNSKQQLAGRGHGIRQLDELERVRGH